MRIFLVKEVTQPKQVSKNNQNLAGETQKRNDKYSRIHSKKPVDWKG
jgi:hypothetical protein